MKFGIDVVLFSFPVISRPDDVMTDVRTYNLEATLE